MPRSQQFDDVYFSAAGGLEETRHVFLQGNDLPDAWQGRGEFTVAETGFGTGLNFLACWQLFERTTTQDQRLHYISVEKYPLEIADIRRYLAPWAAQFERELPRLEQTYPLRLPGFHRILPGPRVFLTLIFDDIAEALPEIDIQRAGVNAWFLDGFTPAKNPEMWTPQLFQNMARLSAPDASFATFTAAGHVRRGLEEAGFYIQKKPGFGKKREMLRGRYTGAGPSCRRSQKTAPELLPGAFSGAKNFTAAGPAPKVAIIGGGLAGTACAHILRRYGATPVIYEKEKKLAPGASGNMLGLYNPRLYADRHAQSDFYTAAYALFLRLMYEQDASLAEEAGFTPCGALHLATSEKKKKRFSQMLKQSGWHSAHLQFLDQKEASALAGLPIEYEGLYLPDSGLVNPQALCHAYARNIEQRPHAEITSPEQLDADAVILACGIDALNFEGLSWLPLHTVRGQISCLKETNTSAQLKTSLCFGGYLSPPVNGRHVTGATFQKWLSHSTVTAQDHQENTDRLERHIPALSGMTVTDGRAALRTASRDHLPLIGAVPGQPGWYLSTGHGSHGLISSLAGAYLLADLICQTPLSLSKRTVNSLWPGRFTS